MSMNDAKKSAGKSGKGTRKSDAETRKVTFRYKAPQASEVLLAACFTKWGEKAKKMRKLKNGTWNCRAELKVGQTYRYRFIVDGEWQDDPDCESTEATPYGNQNCVLVVE